MCSSFKFVTFTFFHSRSAVRAGTPSCTASAKAGPIAKAAAILARLCMQGSSCIGCLDIMGTNIEAKLIEKFACSRLVKADEQQLLDDLLQVDRRYCSTPNMRSDLVGAEFITNQRQNRGRVENDRCHF